MRPYLLIYRAILVNVIGFALLAIAALKGRIAELLAADVTDLVIVIFVVFLIGLAICTEKIVTTSRHLNRLLGAAADPPGPAGLYIDGPPELLAEALKSKLFSRIAVVRQFAAALVVLGLVGNRDRIYHRALGRHRRGSRRREHRAADDLDPHQRHVGRPLYHPCGGPARPLADHQLPNSVNRNGNAL